MSIKKRKIIFISVAIIFISIGLGLVTVDLCHAQGADVQIVPENRKDSGNYELNDFVRVFINVARLIFGLSGSAALLMFVIGGAMFIASGGNEQTVGKAKNIIVAALVGLLIIFGAYMIIQFTLQGLGVVDDGGVFSVFSGTKWFELP